MEPRRVQTRIVRLPGLPEILRRTNAKGRVIDATVKPSSERSSLFPVVTAAAPSTGAPRRRTIPAYPASRAPTATAFTAAPQRRVTSASPASPVPAAATFTAASQRRATSASPVPAAAIPQRRAASASPAPPAQWFMETVGQLNENLSVIMQEIKYLHKRFEDQNNRTQEQIHQTQEQIETLNRSLEHYRPNLASPPKPQPTPNHEHHYQPLSDISMDSREYLYRNNILN